MEPIPRTQPESQTAIPEYDGLDVREILDRIRFHRWKVLLATALFSAGATAIALILPPVYRAEVLLSYVSEDSSGGTLESLASRYGGFGALAGLNLGSSAHRSKDLSMAVLRSRKFTQEFIASRNLLPTLFPAQWNAETRSWKSEDPTKVPTLQDAYRLWDQKIRSIQLDRKSGLITLTIDWRDPELAAAWARDLVTEGNEYLRQKALEETNANLQFIENKLGQTNVLEIRESLFRLMESELKKAMFATASREYAFKVVDPAEVPEKRLRPKRRLIVLGGLILGLIAGVLWALISSPPRADGA